MMYKYFFPSGKILAVIGTYINGRAVNQKGFQQSH